jgi:hypothetical protein
MIHRVIANLVWAGGELYNFFDDPESLVSGDDEALSSPRFWSTWLLITAYFPIVILYCVWIHMTCAGEIPSNSEAARSPPLTPIIRHETFEKVRQGRSGVSRMINPSMPAENPIHADAKHGSVSSPVLLPNDHDPRGSTDS